MTYPAATHAASHHQIDVFRDSPAADLPACIDGTYPADLPRNSLFDYIGTFADTEQSEVRASMIAELCAVFPDNQHVTPARHDAETARNAACEDLCPSQSDCNKNTLAELAVLDVIDTVDAAGDWEPTGSDDPHLAFGRQWLAYIVTAHVITGQSIPASALTAFDPGLCLDDCTDELMDIRNHLIDTEPLERARHVAGMFCALYRYLPPQT